MNSIGRPSARALCVLAVLIGLFGMHGLASDAAGGCHQMPGMTAPSPIAPVGVQARTPSMLDASCVFVIPVGWPPLALVALTFVAAVALSGFGVRRVPDTGARSPPASVLQRVCVSRT